MGRRITHIHGRNRIIASAVGDIWQARGWHRTKPASAVHSGQTSAEALDAVISELDEASAARAAARGTSGCPSAAEYRLALALTKPGKAQRAMLAAHLAVPDHVLTATELAHAAGYADYSAANLHYGTFAFDLGRELDFTPSERGNDGQVIWTFVLATGWRDEEGGPGAGEWHWRLRPELVEALHQSGFRG